MWFVQFLNAILSFIVFVVFVGCDPATPAAPRPELPTARLTVQGNGVSAALTVELAATPEQRQKGLMLRQSMPEDAGMLFLFPGENSIGFWMKNTYIPLSIAYLAADGTVMEIRDGKPLDDVTILTPQRPYRYVLEVNQGWFQRKGLGVGSKVVIPPGLPPAS